MKGSESMDKYNICIACASGMATSHLIMEQLKEMFQKERIPVNLTATRVGDLGTDPHYDLIITSTLLKRNFRCPIYCALSFLTGVGVEKEFDEIVEILKSIDKK